MRKWLVLYVFFIFLSNKNGLEASVSQETHEVLGTHLSAVENFFLKNQVIPRDDADEDVKEILNNPNFLRDLESLPIQIREDSKRNWDILVETLFTDINTLLDSPSLEKVMVVLQLDLREGKNSRFQGTPLRDIENGRDGECTIFINPTAIRVGSLSPQTSGDLWFLGQMISYKEFSLYHELIHLLYWLRAYKDIIDGVPSVNRIYEILDSKKYVDYFWEKWESEDFKRKWKNLEEQIVVIGLPPELPANKQHFSSLGDYSESQMRRIIGIAPRYPYANATSMGEELTYPIAHETTEIIHQVFSDWSPDQLKNAVRPDWNPF